MQKCPQTIEAHAFILKIFVVMNLLPINFLIFLRICSTPKLQKYMASLDFLTYKAIQ